MNCLPTDELTGKENRDRDRDRQGQTGLGQPSRQGQGGQACEPPGDRTGNRQGQEGRQAGDLSSQTCSVSTYLSPIYLCCEGSGGSGDKTLLSLGLQKQQQTGQSGHGLPQAGRQRTFRAAPSPSRRRPLLPPCHLHFFTHWRWRWWWRGMSPSVSSLSPLSIPPSPPPASFHVMCVPCVTCRITVCVACAFSLGLIMQLPLPLFPMEWADK